MDSNLIHMDNNKHVVTHLGLTVPAKINKLMQEKNISQYQLARLSGVPQVTLSRKLRGLGKPFGLDELGAICEALEISPSDLLAANSEKTAA